MKRIVIFIVALFCASAFAQDLPKIAVYVTGEYPDNGKKALGTRMLATFVNSGRYIGIERSNTFLAEVDKEMAKQMSGAIDDKQISELGRQFGVKFVCIADITPAFGAFQVSARIINVETAVVPFIGEAFSQLQTPNDLAQVSDKVVENMFGGKTHKPTPPIQVVQETTPAPPTKPEKGKDVSQMTDKEKQQQLQDLELSKVITRYEEHLEQCAVKKSARCADVMYTLGNLYYDEGKNDYAKAVERFTEEYKQYQNAGIGVAPVHPIPDYSKSLKMYWQLTRDYPKFPKLPDAYFQMSVIYLVAGHLDTTRIILEQLVNRFPNSPRVSGAHFRLADLAFMDNNYNKAYKHLLKVKKNEIDLRSWEMTHYRMGECAYNLGDFKKAIKYFRDYVKACDSGKYKNKEFREMALECIRLIQTGNGGTPEKKAIQQTTPSPQGASIFIATLPTKADIYIGGRLVGKTNEGKLQVPVGTHQVKFVIGDIEKTETMMFQPGDNPTKFVPLK